MKKVFKYMLIVLVPIAAIVLIWQGTKHVPVEGDWKDALTRLATAEFEGDIVTVKNVRNFEYDKDENPIVESWEERTYDLNKLTKVWFVSSPFEPGSPFAHTFLSFEFSDGQYLAITIEARLKKGQEYSLIGGMFRNYPLMYIAADERDVIYLRADSRDAEIYVYPLKASSDDSRVLLTDMLNRMNELALNPEWYNAFASNCTSSIASHVNRIWPGILPWFNWQVIFTGHADKLALDQGLIDTELSIKEARQKFYVSDKSRQIGRVDDYSIRIRQPD